MMSKSPEPSGNPYVVGNPVTGPSFYGREDVFTFVRDKLVASRQNAIVLYGQRRMGKTSILLELPNQLPAGKFHIVYFDLQGWSTKTLPEVLHGLAEVIAKSLGVPTPALTEFKLDRNLFHQGFLPQVWECLSNRNLLLLLDEFDVLDLPDEPAISRSNQPEDVARQELYPYLRKLLDDEKRLAFVFVVGRRLEVLSSWILRVFKEAQHKKIGLLREPEACALIIEPAAGRLAYEPEAIQAILSLTSGHAYFTQLICQELFNRAQRSRQGAVTPDDVRAVIKPALSAGETALAWWWNGLTPDGKLLLSAISEVTAGDESATDDHILAVLQEHRLRPPGTEWNKTVRFLAEWDILEREASGGYRFVVELVHRWVLQAHSLDAEKACIGDLSPQASNAFRTAKEHHTQGRLAEAIEGYRAALADNPNHLAARLGLGQVLRARGDLVAAVEALEEAFWLDESQARASLVDARSALGEYLEHQEKTVEASVHFRRVLELDPKNRHLQEKLRTLYDQGVKAYSAGRWRQAAAYLEQVTDIQPGYQDAPHRLEESRRRAARLIPLRLAVAAVAGLLVGGLIGIAIVGTQAQGGLAVLLARPTSTPTQEAAIQVSATPTLTPQHTPQIGESATATQTLTKEVVTSTREATHTPTPSPGFTPTETATPSPTVTAIASGTPTPTRTATPVIIVVTPTPTPTPPLPSYPAPQLAGPDDGATFSGRPSIPKLEWSPVGELGSNDYYIIALEFQEKGVIVFDGARRKETFWDVDSRFFDRVDASKPEFKWHVVVSHITTDAAGKEVGIDVSPVSETRTFKWTGK